MSSIKNNLNKLALGTVQFGIDYGISNKSGKTPEPEVREILETAFNNGISLIDTAPSYDSSEEVIGQCIENLPFSIVTKTPVFKKDEIESKDATKVVTTFNESLRNLKKSKLYGLLIHNTEDLFVKGGNLLWHALEDLKKMGLVEKIGVSVYSPLDIEKVLTKYKPDIIQAPINVLDQRLLKNSYLKYLKDKGIEIHGRSVFLQGLLLMQPEEIPEYFNSVKPLIVNYHEKIKQNGLTPVLAALGFVYKQKEIDYIIVGVNNKNHLHEIVKAVKNLVDKDEFQYQDYAIDDEAIINPSLWRIT